MTCLTNSFDLTVDVNNNPHIFSYVMASASSVTPYNVYTSFAKRLYDITKDPTGSWNMINIADRVSFSEALGVTPNNLTFIASTCISRSEDGTSIFYQWNDTDTATTTFTNSAPNLYGRMLKVSTQTLSTTTNWTSSVISLAGLARTPKRSPYCINKSRVCMYL